MPRGNLDKISMLNRVIKLKNKLYDKSIHPEWNDKERKSASDILNSVLDIIDEYSR